MTNTPLRTIRIDDDLWAQVNDAAAADGTDTSAWVREALRASLKVSTTVLAVLAAVLLLGACGGAEPASPMPASETAADDGVVTEDEAREVLAEAETPSADPTASAPADCYVALAWEDPQSWQTATNALVDEPAAMLPVLDALPEPAEGCTAEDVASLEQAKQKAEDIRAAIAAGQEG